MATQAKALVPRDAASWPVWQYWCGACVALVVVFWFTVSRFLSHSRKAHVCPGAQGRAQPDVNSMVLTGSRPRKSFCWQAEARCESKTHSLKLPRERTKVVLHTVYRRKAARRLCRCISLTKIRRGADSSRCISLTKIRRGADSSPLCVSSRATRGTRAVGTAVACTLVVWRSVLSRCYYKISAHDCSIASRGKSAKSSGTRSAPAHKLFALAAALCCSCSSWSLTTDSLALLPASSTQQPSNLISWPARIGAVSQDGDLA